MCINCYSVFVNKQLPRNNKRAKLSNEVVVYWDLKNRDDYIQAYPINRKQI